MLSELCQTQRDKQYVHLYAVSRIGTFIETENILGLLGLEGAGMGVIDKCRVSVQSDTHSKSSTGFLETTKMK